MNHRLQNVQGQFADIEVPMEYIISDHQRTLEWCYENMLLIGNPHCPICGSRMNLVRKLDKIDGYQWTCSRRYDILS